MNRQQRRKLGIMSKSKFLSLPYDKQIALAKEVQGEQILQQFLDGNLAYTLREKNEAKESK